MLSNVFVDIESNTLHG